jgi:hypothetical protein
VAAASCTRCVRRFGSRRAELACVRARRLGLYSRDGVEVKRERSEGEGRRRETERERGRRREKERGRGRMES